ncbi:molybdopterin molybdotransferase [Arthrobacter woluwensis]|uniref:molybdopterin-binding protein n=1 Tax=Arthrobacter woluwensis TaxID=156980 RepID=UPI0027848663|nr:molybdopterin-binding protein [Arthrobacter woluwensis]MDQ0707815.1 molybdopterin molybdotransferase [Arthrobacter woluwensis]
MMERDEGRAARLNWDEARALLQERVEALPAVHVPLAQAVGLLAAEDVFAEDEHPSGPRAAVDGWAVNGAPPWVIAEPGDRLAGRQGSRVEKGRPLPPGGKGVLALHDARVALDAEGLAVVERAPGARPGAPRNGENITPSGQALSTGAPLLTRGAVLDPLRLALLAGAGFDTVAAVPKPRVQVIQSGHLATQGRPGWGEDRDALGPVLAPLLDAWGVVVENRVRISGTVAEWRAALEEDADGAAAPVDVVVTVGGTGAGEADHLREALEALGVEYVVDGVSCDPLQTAVAGVLPDGRHVLGLPGTPGEALATLALLGEPLFAALGRREVQAFRPVPSGRAMEAELRPTRLLPGHTVFGMASPCGPRHGLAEWADAELLLVVPPHGVRMGDELMALPLPWKDGDRGTGAPKPTRLGASPSSRAEAASPDGKRAPKAARNSEPIDWAAQDWDSLRTPPGPERSGPDGS